MMQEENSIHSYLASSIQQPTLHEGDEYDSSKDPLCL